MSAVVVEPAVMSIHPEREGAMGEVFDQCLLSSQISDRSYLLSSSFSLLCFPTASSSSSPPPPPPPLPFAHLFADISGAARQPHLEWGRVRKLKGRQMDNGGKGGSYSNVPPYTWTNPPLSSGYLTSTPPSLEISSPTPHRFHGCAPLLLTD
eukprot:763783-Hanusia_phi.AAC.5